MIKANLASYPLHIMNFFKLTKRNNKDLDKINRKSYGPQIRGHNKTKEIPMVAWDVLCKPKFEGGPCIRKNEDVNKDLITKLGWRVLSDNDNVWTIIMRDKYVKNNNFCRIPRRGGDSMFRKRLLTIENILELG